MIGLMRTIILFLLVCRVVFAAEGVKSIVLTPDATDFQSINDEFKGQGIVKKIISTETGNGFYYFVFLEKPMRKEEYRGKVVTEYGVKSNGEWGEVKKEEDDDVVYSIKNLRAFILRSYHGGYDRIQKFQDDGNVVYWPEFVYNDCLVDDADDDGHPEFYLTYFGFNDGLDAKPLKIIVYNSGAKVGDGFLKAKMTAFYPVGNEGDEYRVEYDEAWLSLPDAVKARMKNILESYNSAMPGVVPSN